MKNMKNYTYWLCLGLCLAFLTACSGKGYKPGATAIPKYGTGPDSPIADVQKLPQDLKAYASKVSSGALLSSAEQTAEVAKFKRLFYWPWKQTKAGYSKRTYTGLFGSARGYDGVNRWTSSAWDNLKYNANIAAYPNVQRPAIILRQTSLREMPTMRPRYSRPTPNPGQSPFDYFQYATLPMGLPIYVTQISRDKQWYFIENTIAGGWVQARDVAYVDPAFMKRYQSLPLAALTKDRVQIRGSKGQSLGHAHIGAVFPQASAGGTFSVLVPTVGSGGMAKIATALISSADIVTIPMPITAMNVAGVGNVMMGQTYGWGGAYENRDCSSMLRDMFTPFGISMPRNSRGQYRSGYEMSVAGLDDASKLQTIVAQSKPFKTMIWMPGHIGLYLGTVNGQPVMFHNVWGVRVNEGPGHDDRHIIGRAVVTTLEPGKELPNLYNDQTLIRRIGGISVLPGPQ